MRSRITLTLPSDLAVWLSETANRAGVSQGQTIREILEKARTVQECPFLRLAGAVSDRLNGSTRKGFSKAR